MPARTADARKTRRVSENPAFLRLRAPLGLEVGEDTIQREGGRWKAGLIKGVSAITRGPGLGKDFWIDDVTLDQVVDLSAELDRGVKSRFAHPGLSGDGFGKQLGHVRGLRREGGRAVGDLHFVPSAHRTPSGDLAGYTMDRAEESPEDFGMSIAYRRDFEGELAFTRDHTNDGKYTSPDPENASNLHHLRLKALRAVDVVGSPGANPGGLLGEDAELPDIAEAALDYAFGLSEEAPDELLLGIHPERVRIFVQDFMARHGVALSFGSPDDSGMEGRSAMDELNKASLEELKSERPDLVGQLNSEFAEETAGKAAADVTAAKDEGLAEGRKLERERRGAIVEKAKEYKVELEDGTVESILASDDTVEVAEKAIMQRRLELLEAAAPKTQGAAEEIVSSAAAPVRGLLTAEKAWEKNAKLPSGGRVQDEFSIKSSFLAYAEKDAELRGYFAEADAADES